MNYLVDSEDFLRSCFELLPVDIPFGFTYDNPYNTFEVETVLKSDVDFLAKFEYFRFNNITFVDITVHIGDNMYCGLFSLDDKKIISSAIDRIIRLNS